MKTAQVICIHSAKGKSYCGLPIADVFRSMTAPRLTCKACSAKLQFALTGAIKGACSDSVY